MPNDVFISYCHRDNLPLAVSAGGDLSAKNWVDMFVVRFRAHLRQLLNREVKVWRDHALRGNEELSEEIRCQVTSSRILVPLLSECYLGSTWCLDELQAFEDHARDSWGEAHTSALIHPAKKLPTAPEDLPGALRDKRGVAFYHQDEDKNRTVQWDPSVADHAPRFVEAIYALCDDIRQVIEEGNSKSAASGPIVYLAASDRDPLLTRVRRELKLLGYSIAEQPPGVAGLNEAKFRDGQDELLKDSAVAIMLPGRRPFTRHGLEIERLQWEVIHQRLESGRIKCLAWVDDQRDPVDDGQERWIESLGNTRGVEFLRSAFQKFLADLKGLLIGAEFTSPVPQGDSPVIVVDFHDSDKDHALLASLLEELRALSGCTIKLAWREGCLAAELRRDREDLVAQAGCLILFSARGSSLWMKARYADVLKQRPAFGDSMVYCLALDGAEDKKLSFVPERGQFVMADQLGVIQQVVRSLLQGGNASV